MSRINLNDCSTQELRAHIGIDARLSIKLQRAQPHATLLGLKSVTGIGRRRYARLKRHFYCGPTMSAEDLNYVFVEYPPR